MWSYPRPPRLERSSALVEIGLAELRLVRTTNSLRVLETSHPPVHYVPLAEVAEGVLRPCEHRSWCEWKGEATYFDVVVGSRTEAGAAWTYLAPIANFGPLVDHVAFYPARMDDCWLDGERVQAQQGDFYGGWRTSKVVGPFKGAPGTWGW